MGPTGTTRICGSTISFEWPQFNSEDELPTFFGTISCRPSYDTPSKETFDWEIMDGDHESSLDET
jgi:hypothetical protein